MKTCQFQYLIISIFIMCTAVPMPLLCIYTIALGTVLILLGLKDGTRKQFYILASRLQDEIDLYLQMCSHRGM